MDPHRLAELRSLAYHRAVAARLGANVRAKASAFIDRELAKSSRSAPYLEAWRSLLAGPEQDLLQALTTDDEPSRALRSASPFAGVLTPKERWALWADVKQAHS